MNKQDADCLIKKKIEVEELIENHSRRLRILKNRQAKKGIDTEPHIIIEIEDIETELKGLQKSLQEIKDAIRIIFIIRREKGPSLLLTGYLLQTIPRQIFEKFKYLKSLDLHNNRITEVPKMISQLYHLENLDLSDNKITYLPSQICQLSELKHLKLRGNLLRELPEHIGNLNNLETINIRENQITVLPLSFHKLQKLKEIFCDADRMVFPCSDIIKQGTQAIVDFLGKEAEKKERFRVYLIDPKPNLSSNTKMSICRKAVAEHKRVLGMQEKSSITDPHTGKIQQFTAIGFGETDEYHFQEELSKPHNKILIIEPK